MIYIFALLYWLCTRKLTKSAQLEVAKRTLVIHLQEEYASKTSVVYDYPYYTLEVTLRVKQNDQ